MSIKKISEHYYEADSGTSLKELKEAGWTSSVKLSRGENGGVVRLLKLDIPGLTAAGIDILQVHSGPSRRYHFREEQILPVLKELREFLCEEGLPSSVRNVKLFWVRKARELGTKLIAPEEMEEMLE